MNSGSGYKCPSSIPGNYNDTGNNLPPLNDGFYIYFHSN
jgi:hypothetical protein